MVEWRVEDRNATLACFETGCSRLHTLRGRHAHRGARRRRGQDAERVQELVSRELHARDQEPNKIGLITGNHLVYINPSGLDRLKGGGSSAYPDGTIFVDDVREFSLDDGAYVEGGRKAVP